MVPPGFDSDAIYYMRLLLKCNSVPYITIKSILIY